MGVSMPRIWPYLRSYVCRENGATAIEYALIASGISISIAVIIFVLGGSVQNLFYQRLIDFFNAVL